MFYVNSSILRGSRKESKVSSPRLGCEMQRALGFVAQDYDSFRLRHEPQAHSTANAVVAWLIHFASVSAH